MTSDSPGLELFHRYYETMKTQVGERSSRPCGTLDERVITRFARAVGETDPVHFDRDAAKAAGFAGVVAPPNLLAAMFDWTPGQPEGELNPDGTPSDSARGEAARGLRGMGAGEEMTILAPVVAGTVLTEEEELVDVVLKHGRRGPSVFVTTQHTFLDGSGAALNVNRRTVVMRPPHEEAS